MYHKGNAVKSARNVLLGNRFASITHLILYLQPKAYGRNDETRKQDSTNHANCSFKHTLRLAEL